jgi:hypothetical protein
MPDTTPQSPITQVIHFVRYPLPPIQTPDTHYESWRIAVPSLLVIASFRSRKAVLYIRDFCYLGLWSTSTSASTGSFLSVHGPEQVLPFRLEPDEKNTVPNQITHGLHSSGFPPRLIQTPMLAERCVFAWVWLSAYSRVTEWQLKLCYSRQERV